MYHLPTLKPSSQATCFCSSKYCHGLTHNLWTVCKKNPHSAALSSTPMCGSFKKNNFHKTTLSLANIWPLIFQFVSAIPVPPFSTPDFVALSDVV